MLLLLVRANLVNTSSNGVSCLFCPVLLTLLTLGTLLDLLLIDLALIFESFTLAGGGLSVHGLLLQRILVAWFTPLTPRLLQLETPPWVCTPDAQGRTHRVSIMSAEASPWHPSVP